MSRWKFGGQGAVDETKKVGWVWLAGQTVTNQPSLAEDSSDIVDKLGNP
jgi:hypothetical protein